MGRSMHLEYLIALSFFSSSPSSKLKVICCILTLIPLPAPALLSPRVTNRDSFLAFRCLVHISSAKDVAYCRFQTESYSIAVLTLQHWELKTSNVVHFLYSCLVPMLLQYSFRFRPGLSERCRQICSIDGVAPCRSRGDYLRCVREQEKMIGYISEPEKISAKGTIAPKAEATMTGFQNYWQKIST